MSLFNENYLADIRKAILYFNSKSKDKQAYIITNFLALEKQDEEKLKPLLFIIRNDISNYDETKIANRLFELGLDKTYSILLVKNIIEQIPTDEYDLKQLSNMDDQEFKKKFPQCMNEMWIERKQFKELSQELEIPIYLVVSIGNITRNFMDSLLKSELSEKKIRSMCKLSDFSESKIDVLVNTLLINSEHWRNTVIFRNTQKTYFESQNKQDTRDMLADIKKQNDLILRIMQEIAKTFKIKD